MTHIPVLREEVVSLLSFPEARRAVDCTLGLGGHAQALLDANSRLTLLGIDQDTTARAGAAEQLAAYGDRVTVVAGRFGDVSELARDQGFEPLDMLLADIGVSNMHLTVPERGFSFLHDGPLDMRMDQSADIETAADIIAQAHEADLVDIFLTYGEEWRAKRFANEICSARRRRRFETTRELADFIAELVGLKDGHAKVHPATKVFQALRIAVNDELGELERLLASFPLLMAPGGRVGIISFHSLEDRMVKQAFRTLPRDEWEIVTKHVVGPSLEEVRANPKSRSAKLRVVQKRAS